MSLNLNIRALRKAKRMSLADLAGQIGVSVPHLSEVERGVKNLNNHLLERLSVALDVQPDDLIAGGAKPSVARLKAAVAQLEDPDVDRVVAFAEALLLAEQGPPQKQ